MDTEERKSLNSKFFNLLSSASGSLSAPLSCYYKYKVLKLQKRQKSSAATLQFCSFCGHTLTPGADRFRIQSKRRMTTKMKKLLERDTLKKYQKVCVDRFLQDSNNLKVTCSMCNKTSSFPGQSRMQREQQKSQLISPEVPIEKTRKGKKGKKKDKKRQNRKQTTGYIQEQIQDINNFSKTNSSHEAQHETRLSLNTTQSPKVESRLKPQPNTSTSVLSKYHSAAPSTDSQNKLTRKTRGKNIHQQLTKMLKEEKKNVQNPNSLKNFLSSL